MIVVALVALCPAVARADWNGDGHADVLGENSAGHLFDYTADGAGWWINGNGQQIGGNGWSFPALLYPGDFSGDGHPDLLAIDANGKLWMYRGDGAGGFLPGVAQQVGEGWSGFKFVLAPGDFSGDGHPDLLAVATDGAMWLYRGNGDGWWLDTSAQQIGGGWAAFTAVLPAGDFNGDGHADVFARTSDGHLLLYRGNGSGGWIDGTGGQVVGSGWGGFTVLLGGGDFDGDGLPDVLAQTSDGHLFMYRGNGAGGWITGRGDPLGEGFSSLSALTFVPGVKTPTPPPPPPPAPPVVPVPGGNVQVKAGKHCTVPGGRMKVTLKVHHVPGRAAAHVRRVVFFVPHGSRLVDHHRPYLVHLRMNQPAGTRGRVYARIYFRRAGERKLRHRTVSRRFRMCG